MRNLYFLLTLLPELEYPKKPFISRDELYTLIEANVSNSDRKQFHQFREWKDIENIRRILLKEPLLPGGNLSELDLLDAISFKSGLPLPVLAFLETYSTKEEILKNFPRLMRTLYRNGLEDSNYTPSNYLNKLIRFEERARLTLASIRSQTKFSSSVAGSESHLQIQSGQMVALESDEDDIFIEKLQEAQKGIFDLPEPFNELVQIYESKRYSPIELELALSKWRYDRYEDLASPALYSFDQALLYAVRFDILEHVSQLEYDTGLSHIQQLFEVS